MRTVVEGIGSSTCGSRVMMSGSSICIPFGVACVVAGWVLYSLHSLRRLVELFLTPNEPR